MYRIDQLEDAIVSVVTTAGYDVRPMNRAPVESELSKEALEKPVVLVVFQKCERAETNFNTWKGSDFIFQLFIAARNLKSADAAERGDAASTGIYSILEGLRGTLGGNDLGLTIQPMAWLSEKAEIRTGRLSVYSQDWKITIYE
ncbi:MAG: hypothetical protein IEMM0002_1233 [bacterium]|nr:MAG: hypothetical protein IEMM0002_1233 [bacterium]